MLNHTAFGLPKEIYQAVVNNQLDQVTELLKLAEEIGLSNASNEYIDPQTGNYALHAAAENGNEAIISLLLQYRADPEVTNNTNKTPIKILENKCIDTVLNINGTKILTSSGKLHQYGLLFSQKLTITYTGEEVFILGLDTK